MIPAPATANFTVCGVAATTPAPTAFSTWIPSSRLNFNAASACILATRPRHTAINACRAVNCANPTKAAPISVASKCTIVANAIAAIATIMTLAFTTSAAAVFAIDARSPDASPNASTPDTMSLPREDEKNSPVSPSNAASTPAPLARNAA
ncbi:hypothetical protein DMC61_37790 [Amycolatopsis sp. WAC 04169]|nr:hypothetical protein DMC61_37790 [Amycolatopsis sp. WAC 04169]